MRDWGFGLMRDQVVRIVVDDLHAVADVREAVQRVLRLGQAVLLDRLEHLAPELCRRFQRELGLRVRGVTEIGVSFFCNLIANPKPSVVN